MPLGRLGLDEGAKYQRLTETDTAEQSERGRPSIIYKIVWHAVVFALGVLLGACIVLLTEWMQQSPKLTLSSRINELRNRKVLKIFDARPEWTPPAAGHRELWKQVLGENQAIQGFVIPFGTTPAETEEVYCLSAFHQLHCMDAISSALFSSSHHNDSNETTHHRHLKHCIQYLTQGILCAADMTLEETFLFDTPTGYKDVGTGAWGATHTCADWDAIFDFAKEQRWEPYRATVLAATSD